jgi:hypothetical protein
MSKNNKIKIRRFAEVLEPLLFTSLGLVIGLWLGIVRTEDRVADYITRHPVYSFDAASAQLANAASQIGCAYEAADERLKIAAEQIDAKYAELDQLSKNLVNFMKMFDKATQVWTPAKQVPLAIRDGQ